MPVRLSTHTPLMGYSGPRGAIPGLLPKREHSGAPGHPRCGQIVPTDKPSPALPCPAPKVTFPAPSSDGCLNSSYSSFGAKEGRKDPGDLRLSRGTPRASSPHLTSRWEGVLNKVRSWNDHKKPTDTLYLQGPWAESSEKNYSRSKALTLTHQEA